MKPKKLAKLIVGISGALSSYIGLFWWSAYAASHFRGWSAFPKGMTGFVLIAAVASLFMALALFSGDEK